MHCYDYEVLINGTRAYRMEGELLNAFCCEDSHEFETNFLKELTMRINLEGEIAGNHILKIDEGLGEYELTFFLSALALRTLALIASNKQINQDVTFKIYCDIDGRWNKGFFELSSNRPLEIGERVEILTPTPDKLYPATAMINYYGQVGRIVDSEPGYLHVVFSPNIPAAAFKPSSLKRVIKK